MRADWIFKPLGEVCNVVGGGTPSKRNPAFYDGEIPWATVRDMRHEDLTGTEFKISPEAVKSSATNVIPSGNVVIATRVGLGKVCLLSQDTAINQDLRGIIPKANNLDVRFLFRWLQSVSHIIEAEGTGATVKGVKLPFVKSLKMPVPPLPEQKRIVAILDEAFAGIATAVAITEKNLANARELFESYLNTVFSQRGDGWVDKKLSDICEGKITDGTHQTPKYHDDGFVFLSSRNVKSGTIDWQNVKYVDRSQHEVMQRRVSPRVGDILLAKNGTTGVAAIVDRDILFDIYVSLAFLRPSSEVTSRYLWHFINSPIAKMQFNTRLKGVGVPNLHLKEIREVEICFPTDKSEQARVVEKLDEVLESKHKLESSYQQKLTALSELKQSLLQKAFSGELTAGKEASDAMRQVEQIA